MANFPELSSYGYEILEQIGTNPQGGRITWKAKNLINNEVVVVKQFCFATPNSTWSGYKAYQQEINILQALRHPGIPPYLNSFETKDGFCLIQEYIIAQNLNEKASFNLRQIKLIAQKVLEILVYLQQQNPPILHQDIKPENILIDDLANVYLIDFGIATKFEDISQNTITSIKGTPGFIAPEQAIARNKSSDLYSLGVTIVCLLTNKKSSEIVELITPDNPYQIKFKNLVSDADTAFINWVQKMVQPQVSKRFSDAKSALKALQEIDWELQDNHMTNLQKSLPDSISLSSQKYTFSTLIIVISAMATAIGFQVINRVTEKTMVNFTIATIGMVVIYIAEYGAATALKTDRKAKTEALILAIATPVMLTIVSGFIFGRGEAVAMSVATAIAQTAILTTILWQKLTQDNHKLKIIGLLIAIALGMIFGWKTTI